MKTQFLSFLLFFSLFASYGRLNAQDDKKAAKEEKKAAKAEIKQQKVAEGKGLINPFLMPAYTPEMGLSIAAGALWSFKTNKSVATLKRSNIPLGFGAGVTGAVFAYVRPTIYFNNNKLRWYSDFWYKDMPDNYWGIGSYNAINVPMSDSTTAYTRTWLMFKNVLVYEIWNNLFVGAMADFNYTKGREESAGVLADPNYIVYNKRPQNTGLGIVVQYDSRDIPTNAYEGIYLGLEGSRYSTTLGGDNNYNLFLLDYRQYQNVGRKGQTIAWQFKTRIANGEVPYGEMSQLGNPFDLRGYTWGRFRDESLMFLLVEYRHMFLAPGTEEPGKHGIVVWVGSGTIAPSPGEAEHFIPNFGVGYRFELQPRSNIRIDFGIGRETSGIYMNFNEAF
jgi:hypothetical protein